MADGEFSDDPTIADEAVLWRRVHYENYVDDQNLGRRRPTSHAFGDSRDGSPMSVFLAAAFEDSQVALAGHDRWGLVSITAGLARECGQRIVPDRAPNAPSSHVYVVGPKPNRVRQRLAKGDIDVVLPMPPPL